MAKKKQQADNQPAKPSKKKKAGNGNSRIILGIAFILFSLYLAYVFFTFFIYWKDDQSIAANLSDRSLLPENGGNKGGSFFTDTFVFKGFGFATFIGVGLLFLIGINLVFRNVKRLVNLCYWGVLIMIYISAVLGFCQGEATVWAGTAGYELNHWMQDYIGAMGTALVLLFIGFVIITIKMKLNLQKIVANAKNLITSLSQKTHSNSETSAETAKEDEDEEEDDDEDEDDTQALPQQEIVNDQEPPIDPYTHKNLIPTIGGGELEITQPIDEEEVTPAITPAVPPAMLSPEELAQQLVDNYGEYDPRLELSDYRFPTIDLLNEPKDKGIVINEEELKENNDKIIKTLSKFKIEIQRIKATVGPTVTLYEIVPADGVRISKIKSLEDDIALSLEALGIRIIAPIPGKGTIGIEVPNKKPTTVFMRTMINSSRFQNTDMELPIAFGKTISNETFVEDLTKMPHLLMAGATGQGKSVGINVVLTSLLYKKHPSEVKFVLVDPKKVELSIFEHIERHFLAKLPNNEDAIITDYRKVVNTLNSLCIEMENRYELLKNAGVRNIKEYNTKFKKRMLNPEEGHRFLPYIVLVVDEFADLIMTAGKEVEMPIARLAQLARAIGIHLIIATQRPTVNVITGIIKANFPARIAFKVTAKVDSKTILDGSGAEQLIGRGDMLFSKGNEPIRIQCAFVDTPEVQRINDYIGAQRAYPTPYLLPEYVGPDSEPTDNSDFDPSERDSMFREAAEIVVNSQQGSASFLQRKLKLGYNRAGRIIDQLEYAGIVGPFEGSKARQVLIPDLASLNNLLGE